MLGLGILLSVCCQVRHLSVMVRREVMVCCVENCTNSRITTPHIQIRRFPLDVERCKAWCKAAGRIDIVNQVGTLKSFYDRYFMCSEHFSENQFMNVSDMSSKLRKTAVPTVFGRNLRKKRKTLKKTLKKSKARKQRLKETSGSNSKSTFDTSLLIQEHDTDDDETGPSTSDKHTLTEVFGVNRNLGAISSNSVMNRVNLTIPLMKYLDSKKRLNAMRSKLYRVEKMNERLKEKISCIDKEPLKFDNRSKRFLKENLSDAVYEFVTCQFQKKQRSHLGFRYSEEFKNIAFAIYYHSPKCYRFLSEMFCLPSICILKKWLKEEPTADELRERHIPSSGVGNNGVDIQQVICVRKGNTVVANQSEGNGDDPVDSVAVNRTSPSGRIPLHGLPIIFNVPSGNPTPVNTVDGDTPPTSNVSVRNAQLVVNVSSVTKQRLMDEADVMNSADKETESAKCGRDSADKETESANCGRDSATTATVNSTPAASSVVNSGGDAIVKSTTANAAQNLSIKGLPKNKKIKIVKVIVVKRKNVRNESEPSNKIPAVGLFRPDPSALNVSSSPLLKSSVLQAAQKNVVSGTNGDSEQVQSDMSKSNIIRYTRKSLNRNLNAGANAIKTSSNC